MIALVISIIVMLILAGVSISAIVGEDGILTKAQGAKLAQEEAQRRENLEYMLYDFNADSFLGKNEGNNAAMTSFLSQMKNEGKVGSFLYDDENDLFIIQYDDEWYSMTGEDGTYKVEEHLDSNLDNSGSITGSYIVTVDNVNSVDGITFSSGSSYIVLENISAENFNFYIPAGDPVKIKLMGDMIIDNSAYVGRSAIDLQEGATLDLYVYGNVTVNSSFGSVGGNGSSAEELNGGAGANAGIHVGKNSTLNLYGSGKIKCYGGDAGDGGTCIEASLDYGAAGGGGAGAGIGGNGGDGADSIYFLGGLDGEAGEDAGSINIYDTVKVYAFGGGGGSGGKGTPSNGKGGGGGGAGYPAAGIGGGGAGGGAGDTAVGGGGFSGAASECKIDVGGLNGLYSEKSTIQNRSTAGGYFSVGVLGALKEEFAGTIGGGQPYSSAFRGGNGGIAGSGGTVVIYGNKSRVYAYNGAYITNVDAIAQDDNWKASNQTCIYSQAGYSIKELREDYDESTMKTLNPILNKTTSWIDGQGHYKFNPDYYQYDNYSIGLSKIRQINARNMSDLLNELGTSYQSINYQATINYGNIGIGSGAGYVELSNGTCTVNPSLN